MPDSDFDVHPDDCPHPESEIETVRYIRSGTEYEQCQACGFNFHIIADHRRVVLHGDTWTDADLECADCGLEAEHSAAFRHRRCEDA